MQDGSEGIVRYFVKALTFIPLFVDACGKRGKSEDYKEFGFTLTEQEPITTLLNSTLFYWFADRVCFLHVEPGGSMGRLAELVRRWKKRILPVTQ